MAPCRGRHGGRWRLAGASAGGRGGTWARRAVVAVAAAVAVSLAAEAAIAAGASAARPSSRRSSTTPVPDCCAGVARDVVAAEWGFLGGVSYLVKSANAAADPERFAVKLHCDASRDVSADAWHGVQAWPEVVAAHVSRALRWGAEDTLPCACGLRVWLPDAETAARGQVPPHCVYTGDAPALHTGAGGVDAFGSLLEEARERLAGGGVYVVGARSRFMDLDPGFPRPKVHDHLFPGVSAAHAADGADRGRTDDRSGGERWARAARAAVHDRNAADVSNVLLLDHLLLNFDRATPSNWMRGRGPNGRALAFDNGLAWWHFGLWPPSDGAAPLLEQPPLLNAREYRRLTTSDRGNGLCVFDGNTLNAVRAWPTWLPRVLSLVERDPLLAFAHSALAFRDSAVCRMSLDWRDAFTHSKPPLVPLRHLEEEEEDERHGSDGLPSAMSLPVLMYSPLWRPLSRDALPRPRGDRRELDPCAASGALGTLHTSLALLNHSLVTQLSSAVMHVEECAAAHGVTNTTVCAVPGDADGAAAVGIEASATVVGRLHGAADAAMREHALRCTGSNTSAHYVPRWPAWKGWSTASLPQGVGQAGSESEQVCRAAEAAFEVETPHVMVAGAPAPIVIHTHGDSNPPMRWIRVGIADASDADSVSDGRLWTWVRLYHGVGSTTVVYDTPCSSIDISVRVAQAESAESMTWCSVATVQVVTLADAEPASIQLVAAGDTVVLQGDHVRVRAGSVFLLEEGASILVPAGTTLVTEGTAEAPIVFTRAPCFRNCTGEGGWNEILVSGNAQLAHTWFVGGGADASRKFGHSESEPVLRAAPGSRVSMHHSGVLDSPGKALASVDARVSLESVVLARCDTGGQFDASVVSMTGCHVSEIPDGDGVPTDDDNDGLYLFKTHSSGEPSRIVDSWFSWGEDDALDVNEADVEVAGTMIDAFAHEGVAASGFGGAGVVVKDSEVTRCRGAGVEAGYGSPHVRVSASRVTGNHVGIRFGDTYDWGSNGSLSVDGGSVTGNEHSDYLNHEVRQSFVASSPRPEAVSFTPDVSFSDGLEPTTDSAALATAARDMPEARLWLDGDQCRPWLPGAADAWVLPPLETLPKDAALPHLQWMRRAAVMYRAAGWMPTPSVPHAQWPVMMRRALARAVPRSGERSTVDEEGCVAWATCEARGGAAHDVVAVSGDAALEAVDLHTLDYMLGTHVVAPCALADAGSNASSPTSWGADALASCASAAQRRIIAHCAPLRAAPVPNTAVPFATAASEYTANRSRFEQHGFRQARALVRAHPNLAEYALLLYVAGCDEGGAHRGLPDGSLVLPWRWDGAHRLAPQTCAAVSRLSASARVRGSGGAHSADNIPFSLAVVEWACRASVRVLPADVFARVVALARGLSDEWHGDETVLDTQGVQDRLVRVVDKCGEAYAFLLGLHPEHVGET